VKYATNRCPKNQAIGPASNCVASRADRYNRPRLIRIAVARTGSKTKKSPHAGENAGRAFAALAILSGRPVNRTTILT